MSAIPGTQEPGYVEPRVMAIAVPEFIRRLNPGSLGLKAFVLGETRCLLAREPAGAEGEPLWHLSISCEDRHPTWDEIKTARYRLLSTDLCFGMLLPPPDFYVNIEAQDHVFHLWEITDPREPWSGL